MMSSIAKFEKIIKLDPYLSNYQLFVRFRNQSPEGLADSGLVAQACV